MSLVFLSTRGHDVARLPFGAPGDVAESVLAGARIRALAVDALDPRRVYAGGNGVWRSEDAGATWTGPLFEGRDVTSLAARGGLVVAGLRPAALAMSEDRGATWRERPLPRAWWWWTPSETPMTAYVQAVALSEAALVVGVEVGGVLASHDGGRTWTKGKGAILDCHGLCADPHDARRFWQAGAGLSHAATSDDGGRTWRKARGLRSHAYGWAVAADPARPGRCFATSSTGPWAAHGGRDARAVLSGFDGTVAAPVGAGWRSMPYGLAARREGLFLGLAHGSVQRSVDEGATWSEVGRLGRIERAFVVAG